MTRKIVYSVALVSTLAGKSDASQYMVSLKLTLTATATVMTLTSIIIPRWISWNSETVRTPRPAQYSACDGAFADITSTVA